MKIAPQIARLYPTVVIKETALYDMYLDGSYTPLSEDEAVNRTKAMYEILDNAGINIIRVGLKSSDIMADQPAFHPAFRQLVEGRIARESLEAQVDGLYSGVSFGAERFTLFISNEKCYNNMFGHKGVNRRYFADKYPKLDIRYVKDSEVGLSLADNRYRVLASETDPAELIKKMQLQGGKR